MTESSTRAPTAGARIVRAFRMQRPDDVLLRRVQEAFALMLLTAGAATMLQLLLVVLLDGPHTAPHWSRVANNGMLVVVMLSSLFGFLTRGRVHASVRATGVGILIYDISFAVCFGLRSTPSIFVMTLAILAGLSIIERARILALWAAAFSIVLLGGLIITPQWTFSPGPLSLVSGPALALVFFSIYVLEFRDAMLSTTDAVRAQAAMLSTTNAELRRTIDERDRLTEQLAMTHRLEAMGRMAGSIAHDFNNQLTVIRGYSDLIAAETPSESSLRPDVEHLVRAVARASSITRDVLDFAAPRLFAMQPVDVVAYTRELAPNFRQVLAPRVRLDLDLPDHAAYARLDRAQLERLLLNLLTNAREVTPEGGLVSVILRHDAGRVRWQVRDGGPGVPHALRDRIFEPFFTTKGTTGGTGLGLASAFAIARQHDGTLRVGDAPNGGAEFVLELSACAECTAPVGEITPELARRANGLPLHGVVVMLVEDDVALARLGTRLLQRAGAIVQRYDNGVDAVASLREARATQALPQLIITDLRLPRGSGAEVIEVARQVNAAVPVVAVSGFLEDPLVAELAARQELSFLAKPFSEQQLLDAIDMAQRFAAV